MNRRDAALLLLASFASFKPALVRAQAPVKVARVGYLGPSAETAPHLLKAFKDGLAALGYVEGRTLVVEYRWTNAGSGMSDATALTASARELVSKKLDVLAVSIDPAILAARKVAGALPIVMMNVSDPVGLGLVASLAHPGGNLTGLTRLSPELIGKSVEVLMEAVPQAKRLALLVNTSSSINPVMMGNARQAAQVRGVALQVVEASTVQELDAVLAALKRDKVDALLVAGGGIFFTQRAHLAELAMAQRLPAIYANVENVEAGGLMSYSPSSSENYRRAASFIDKILRGAKAGDIPIEQPTMFELSMNMKTAKAMKVTIPQSLLLRVDRLIE